MKRILDVSKWRCGMYGAHAMGQGNTEMRNEQGFECCLGQFAAQQGFHPEGDDPIRLAQILGGAYDPAFVQFCLVRGFEHTPLAKDLLAVNDDQSTTPLQKISLLREFLRGEGDTLEVINAPADWGNVNPSEEGSQP